MDVLITGSAGFLGRHFKAVLEARGDYVLGVDVNAGADPYYRDALDFFREDPHDGWDLVLHCAAVSPHRTAIDCSPLRVGAGNLMLDAELFQWAARTRPGRVVYFSSSAAYPTWLQERPYRLAEVDIRKEIRPDAIYGWLKLTGERLADAYRRQGGAVTVVRPFSGYGEDQSSNFPFGAFRDRAKARQDPFEVWGDGTQVRDWIHVDDLVGAVLAAVEAGVDGPVNLCTGAGTSMVELAHLFCETAGYDPVIRLRPEAPAGVAYRVGDPTQLHEIYTPQVSLREGVARALEVAHV